MPGEMDRAALPIPQGYLEQAYDNFSTCTTFSDGC